VELEAGFEPPAALGAWGDSAPNIWVLRAGPSSFFGGGVEPSEPNICVEELGRPPAGLGDCGATAPNIWVELVGFEGDDDTGGLFAVPNIIVWLDAGWLEPGGGVFASGVLSEEDGGNAVNTCWHRVH
jgi:hypothetical protein